LKKEIVIKISKEKGFKWKKKQKISMKLMKAFTKDLKKNIIYFTGGPGINRYQHTEKCLKRI
jgi:hypothetical protein